MTYQSNITCAFMTKLNYFSLFLALLILISPGLKAQNSPVFREELPSLSQYYAGFRKDQLSNVSYNLSITLDAASDIFTGTVQIGLDLDPDNVSPMTIDFEAGEVLSLMINGVPARWDYQRWFLTIEADQLSSGRNDIIINFRRPFTTDGDGLHKFIDPINGEVYLYTNFEPYNANRLFPHFDQPNLKAPFTLDVTAPARWQIISNWRETKITDQGETKHWQFPATPPLSSYLYALHAGPFTVWEESAEDILMRIFSRNSLARYVDPEEWFEPTRSFLAFYQEYYDVQYPINKYDQIIVPDFNPGAMENMGAVTFNEAYISRGVKTYRERAALAYVIAHEMAHMWFGNMVTMEWWNDLWLNESFATYMGYLALAEVSEFSDAWDIFYSSEKSVAYQADARATTHPVAPSSVPTTAAAFASFDAITYEKGSSILKQFPYFIGEDNFRIGVSNYLKEHLYSNAKLDDFVNALTESAGIDLSSWKKQWLQQSGVNSLHTEFSCSNNLVSSLRLVQSVPDNAAADKVLRSQRIQLGLYRYTNNAMLLSNAIPVTYRGVVTWVPEAIGSPCPDLVLPNEGDHAYVDIKLDPVSRATLIDHINDFSNITTRLMLWASLWSDVREASLSLDDFLDFAFNNLPGEQDTIVLRQVGSNLATSFNYFTAFGNYDDRRKKIESFILSSLEAAEPGSEVQRIWFTHFLNMGHTKEALDMMLSLLDGSLTLEGIEIDQDMRWDMVLAANRYSHGDYDAILSAESARDPSDQGKNSALAVRAVRPDPAVKAELLDVVLDAPDTYKLASLRFIMRYLFPTEQHILREPYADRILAALPAVNASDDQSYMSAVTSLIPDNCTAVSVSRLEAALDTNRDLHPVIARALRVNLQEDQRCVKLKSLLIK